MFREIIEMEIEVKDEQLAMAMSQLPDIQTGLREVIMPALIRQIFFELPASSQVALQLPQLMLQKVPQLEDKRRG
jgi:hypothetical protein